MVTSSLFLKIKFSPSSGNASSEMQGIIENYNVDSKRERIYKKKKKMNANI